MLTYFTGYGPENITKILDETLSFRRRANILTNGFDWKATPQGYVFWYDEYSNLCKHIELSHEALMYLTVELNNGSHIRDNSEIVREI